MVIGYLDDGYPEKRMIIGIINSCDIQYKKIHKAYDIRYLLQKLGQLVMPERVFKRMQEIKCYEYCPMIPMTVDLVHVFNVTCFMNKKWITTYEAVIPSVYGVDNMEIEKRIKQTTKAILQKQCLRVLAMSEWAYERTLNLWENYLDHDTYLKCKAKLEILEPPQKVLITYPEIQEKFSQLKCFKFVFVGREFWRKGGNNLIRILSGFKKKYQFHLTIISEIDSNRSVLMNSHENEIEEIIKKLNGESWITWHRKLSNDAVLKILKQSHIGFLPTYNDTYGFSVLEMQACGCPVVSTNINALKLINNSERGWIIKLDPYNRTEKVNYREDEEKMSSIIDDGLRETLWKIFNSSEELILSKAYEAVKYIKKVHSPLVYGKKLYEIYNFSNVEVDE